MANSAPSIFSAPDGKVVSQIGITSSGNDVVVQPDGKIVVAGRSTGPDSHFALLRYNADGTLDPTFGSGGKLSTPIGSSSAGACLVLQPDGKIVVAGNTTVSGNTDFAVARYTANGTLDTTFSGDGFVGTAIDSGLDRASSIALQTDGRIVVAGMASGASNYDFAVVRYNSDGSLDTMFSGDGKAAADISTGGGSDYDEGYAVAIQPDGKIVVVGTSFVSTDYDFGVARFNADGSLDTSFAGDGKRTVTFGLSGVEDRARSVVIQPDGKIVMAGSSGPSYNADFAMLRLNSDGTMDTSFGAGGRVKTALGPDAVAYSMLLQPDGKFVVAGLSSIAGGGTEFAVVRYNSDGSLDTAFGSGGKVTMPVGSDFDQGLGVALQPDGKIFVTGSAQHAQGLAGDFATLRLNADGSLDTTFGATRLTEGGPRVVIDEGLFVFDAEAVTSLGNYNGASVLLTRAGGAQGEDVFGISGALSQINDGGPLVVDGVIIGTVIANSGGKLLLSFNASATPTLFAAALHQITYANSSEAPPASVALTWTISDGAGSGPLSASATTIVHITPVNDAPVITSNGGGAAAGTAVVENTTLVTTLSGVDVDSPFAFSLAGVDAGKFHLIGNQLHFATSADFDTRTDANGDGIYDVTVIASDGVAMDTQALSVSLVNVPGHKIKGTSKSEKIDTSHKIKGKGATAEEDKIDGKKGNDSIKGGGDNDTLIGGEGKDMLAGKGGHDRFVFKDKLVASNVDVVKDFKHDIDVLALDDKVFKEIGAALGNKEFYAKQGATEAHDKNDRIIYDKKTGALYYDADGNKNGGLDAVHFATLVKHPVIDAGDFIIV